MLRPFTLLLITACASSPAGPATSPPRPAEPTEPIPHITQVVDGHLTTAPSATYADVATAIRSAPGDRVFTDTLGELLVTSSIWTPYTVDTPQTEFETLKLKEPVVFCDHVLDCGTRLHFEHGQSVDQHLGIRNQSSGLRELGQRGSGVDARP